MYVEVTWFGMIVFFAVLIIERRKGRKRDGFSGAATDCEKHAIHSDETEDATDPMYNEGYEWWEDPRWRD